MNEGEILSYQYNFLVEDSVQYVDVELYRSIKKSFSQ